MSANLIAYSLLNANICDLMSSLFTLQEYPVSRILHRSARSVPPVIKR
eukprot:UN08792